MVINKKLVLIFSLGIGLLVFLGSYGVAYTSQPSFCTNCHEVAPAVTNWESSAHNSVDCLKCHAEPGMIGTLERKLGAWKEVKSHLFDDLTYADLETIVPANRCFACHKEEELFQDKPFHEQFVNVENKSCASCHREAIHPS